MANNRDVYFQVRFRYPRDEAEARRATRAAERQAAQEQAARARLSDSVAHSGTKNWQYLAAGSRSLQPSSVYDNGDMTVLSFKRSTRLPAVYMIGTDGEERLANTTVHRNEVIVHGVAHEIRLRLGREVTAIYNMGVGKWPHHDQHRHHQPCGGSGNHRRVELMAKDQDHPGEGQTLEGERGITSITEATGKPGSAEIGKKLGLAAGIAFLGVLAWLQWPSAEEQPAETVAESTRRIRAGGEFQPAEISDPQPESVVTAAAKIEEPPVGPIERIRIEQEQLPAEPSQAEILFESSKRAPLMAYEGSVANINQAADAAARPARTAASSGTRGRTGRVRSCR